jgi:hypothetical protein
MYESRALAGNPDSTSSAGGTMMPRARTCAISLEA